MMQMPSTNETRREDPEDMLFSYSMHSSVKLMAVALYLPQEKASNKHKD